MHNSTYLFQANDAGWQSWTERCRHDFYHTAAYHRYSESYGEGAAYLAVYGDRDRFLALPYLLRDIDIAGISSGCAGKDVTSVYGYAGPLVCGNAIDADFEREAWRAIYEIWRNQDVVSAFARLHPLLNNHSYVLISQPGEAVSAELLEVGPTVSLDLTQSDEEAWAEYRRTTRGEIRQGRKRGLAVTVDEEWTHLDCFLELYYITMKRNQASAYYYFSREQILDLKEALGKHALLVHVWSGNLIISSAIFIEYDGILHAHLEGNHPEYLKQGPFKLMVDELRLWGRQRGDRGLHLGGGRGGQEDSLFLFKAGLSKKRHPFFVARWIVDPSRYEWLVQERRREADASDLALDTGSYFPAYRAPLACAPPPAASEPETVLA
jgi:hypothetical protein